MPAAAGRAGGSAAARAGRPPGPAAARRAAGQPREAFLRERLFAPLGMRDTGFSVPADKLDRLATSYVVNPEGGALLPFDDPAESFWSRPPAFPSAGGGLVSTIDDVLAF